MSETDSVQEPGRWMQRKRYTEILAERDRLVTERAQISQELLAHHHGKPAQWVRTRLTRIDRLGVAIKRLEERLS